MPKKKKKNEKPRYECDPAKGMQMFTRDLPNNPPLPKNFTVHYIRSNKYLLRRFLTGFDFYFTLNLNNNNDGRENKGVKILLFYNDRTHFYGHF